MLSIKLTLLVLLVIQTINAQNRTVINTKTAIIGSGMSGISTSMDLLKAGYKDFLVFEALNRVGGRINTINYEDSFLENGAQYVEGQENNPIYYIARDNKLIDPKFDEILLEDPEAEKEAVYVTKDGKVVDQATADRLSEILDDVLGAVELKGTKDYSIGDGFYPAYISRVEDDFDKDLSKPSEVAFKRIVDGMFIWRCRFENVELGSFSLYSLSLKYYGTFVGSPGAQMQLTNGYRTVVDAIINKDQIGYKSRLYLNSPLVKVLLAPTSTKAPCDQCKYTTDRSKVVLLFSDKIVICDHVLMTMSVGYMKANLPTLVEPASFLPKDKLDALKRLGFGAVNKVRRLI